MFDMLLTESQLASANIIHIMAPFVLGNGGDWHAIDLYLQYSKTHKVMLWSHQPPHEEFKTNYSVRQIKPYSGLVPNQGILIISGARTEIGPWVRQSTFKRILMLHNLLSPSILYRALNHLNASNKQDIEVIYASNLVKKYSGLPGRVVHHLPTKDRFRPEPSMDTNRPFTVGRISTDLLAKHHYSDIKIYEGLVKAGVKVRITGGTCLMPWLGNNPSIELLPTVRQVELAQTYNGLDCFYYRVPSTVKDPFPNVVMEAMLSGLPVVCHRDVGSIEVIEHGISGFIFDTPQEALEIIMALKNNANLRKEIGINAQLSLAKLQNDNYESLC